MRLALDDAGFEPVLEEVAAAGIAPVEPHRIDAVQALHSAGELGLCRFDEQVKMVVEQIPRVHAPAEPPLDVDEELEPGFAVAIIQHDRPLLDATADDVVPGRTRQPAAWNPRHGVRRYRAVCSGETVVKGHLPGTVPGTRPSRTPVVQTGADARAPRLPLRVPDPRGDDVSDQPFARSDAAAGRGRARRVRAHAGASAGSGPGAKAGGSCR